MNHPLPTKKEVDEALIGINIIRQKLNLPPVRAILKGKRSGKDICINCPIARTILYGAPKALKIEVGFCTVVHKKKNTDKMYTVLSISNFTGKYGYPNSGNTSMWED